MKKIVSFGDSFIRGSEIIGNQSGKLGWPGIAADELGFQFETCAQDGCGNQKIAKQVIDYFCHNRDIGTLAVINWTWSVRWDILDRVDQPDITIGPTCVPEKLQHTMVQESAAHLLDFYNHFLQCNPHCYVMHSLQSMLTTQHFLRRRGIANVQTYMDHWMFEKNLHGSLIDFYLDIKEPAWPQIVNEQEFGCLPDHIRSDVQERYHSIGVPSWITVLQDTVASELQSFEGLNFLDWSRRQGFEITAEPNLHPLKPAHQAAAEFWKQSYAQALT